MPAAPPIVQCAPMSALPAMPTQPAIAVCPPMRTLWPIWIRLSSFTPSSITVSSSAPRSMQVLAPISTSSPMRTAPSCSIFTQAPSCGAKPKPSAPITTPGCSMQRSPITQSSPTVTRGLEHRVARRCARPRSTTHSAPMRARWDRSRASGSITALGWMRAARGRRMRALPQLGEPGEIEVGVVGDDAGAARAAASRMAGPTMTQPAREPASCCGTWGWLRKLSWSGCAVSSGARPLDRRARRRRAARRPAPRRWRRAAAPRRFAALLAAG